MLLSISEFLINKERERQHRRKTWDGYHNKWYARIAAKKKRWFSLALCHV